MIRVNDSNPRSMYLFLIRVQRVLYKNHGKFLSSELSDELKKIEVDAKNHYYKCSIMKG